ncbi:MAG: DUF732 domain-containing protein [Mycolicibacterium cosmeticum]|nr:DUF732 domain-containing protein [Mycolicibacterium cosmeticum]
MSTRRKFLVMGLAVGALLVAVAVVLGALALQNRQAAESAPAPPTVPPAPSGDLSAGDLAQFDQQLLTSLRSKGLDIANPAMTARDAHLICARLQHGQSVDQVKRDYSQVTQGDASVADVFVSTVMTVYPSCP